MREKVVLGLPACAEYEVVVVDGILDASPLLLGIFQGSPKRESFGAMPYYNDSRSMCAMVRKS